MEIGLKFELGIRNETESTSRTFVPNQIKEKSLGSSGQCTEER